MKIIYIVLLLVSTLFSNSPRLVMMNSVKELIQKEEYISLAVNKYIIETGKIPKKTDDTLDWVELSKNSYLGQNFDKKNPFTKANLLAKFDKSNSLYIYGLGELTNKIKYNEKYKYLYSFYTNRSFRVNTQAPITNMYDEIKKGSEVIYGQVQKEIIQINNTGNYIVSLHSAQCPTNNYYYELKNSILTFKFCKGDHTSFKVYQEEPIYLEDWNDLTYIKSDIGAKAYVNKNGNWFEYYYQGGSTNPWIPVRGGSTIVGQDEESDIEDRIISYIPNAKDLVLRNKNGCMLANGDIFCWGKNTNKKAGIETNGQLSTNIKPDYVNTPVMLRVQIDNKTKIDNTTRKDKRWYNNPYRVKFEKMAFNRTNVCGISPIFDYFQNGAYKKFGGDLYCNGRLSSKFYDDISDSSTPEVVTTSILKRNKHFYSFKDDEIDNDNQNEIYLIDVAMVDDTIAVLSDTGDIYTIGSNYKGALGINNTNEDYVTSNVTKINNQNQNFKKIYALRDIKCFGAIDSNNNFWMWGERPGYNSLFEPTKISAYKFDSNFILVNSKDFILKASNKNFYRTYNQQEISKLSSIPTTALSASFYEVGSSKYYLYVDENRQLQGSSDLITCRNINDSNCTTNDKNIFTKSFEVLNKKDLEVNGKKYASFSNTSIYEYKPIYLFEDFEKEASKEHWKYKVGPDLWKDATLIDGNDFTGKYLGNFGAKNQEVRLKKTFDFGSVNGNKKVTISFDFYEIDSWDEYSPTPHIDFFQVKINNTSKGIKNFSSLESYKDGGGFIGELGTLAVPGNSKKDPIYFDRDEKHTYSYDVELNSSGQVVLEFISKLDQDISDESWGIDNLEIKSQNEESKKFVCAMIGLGSSSQMYCWGNAGRMIPILSTSLYDVSKISHINKLFITQESDSSKKLAFDEFNNNNNGELFLKYPTYLGGFDYEFYFK